MEIRAWINAGRTRGWSSGRGWRVWALSGQRPDWVCHVSQCKLFKGMVDQKIIKKIFSHMTLVASRYTHGFISTLIGWRWMGCCWWHLDRINITAECGKWKVFPSSLVIKVTDNLQELLLQKTVICCGHHVTITSGLCITFNIKITHWLLFSCWLRNAFTVRKGLAHAVVQYTLTQFGYIKVGQQRQNHP